MDKDLIKEMDIEDQYHMVPVSLGKMQCNKPYMSTYSMEEDLEDEKSRNKCKVKEMQMNPMYMKNMDMMMNPMCMNPMHMMNPMGMGAYPMCPMPINPMIMHHMLQCMMYCIHCMKMPQKYMFPMDSMEPTMMLPFMRNEMMDDIYDLEDDMYNPKYVDMVLEKLEYSNPDIFKTMKSYGISYDESKNLCRKIISFTLK